jgi:hypothetical protein
VLLLLYTEKPVPRSKELVVVHDDSSKKARLQKIQILDTETHLLLQLITPVREDWIKLERERERERIVVGGGEWPAIYKGFNFHVINTNPKSMRHLMVYTHLMIVSSFTGLPLLCILSVNHNPFFIEWTF